MRWLTPHPRADARHRAHHLSLDGRGRPEGAGEGGGANICTQGVSLRSTGERGVSPLTRALTRGIHRVYQPALHRALAHPRATLVAAFAVFFASLGLVPVIGFSLFPSADIPQFTIRIPRRAKARPYVASTSGPVELREVTRRLDLSAGTWRGEDDFVDLCIDLSKGRTEVAMEAQ